MNYTQTAINTQTGPRLRFAPDGPGILRHLEPAIRRLIEQQRYVCGRVYNLYVNRSFPSSLTYQESLQTDDRDGGDSRSSVGNDILSPLTSNADIRSTEVAALLVSTL